jgi:hypothetical protein
MTLSPILGPLRIGSARTHLLPLPSSYLPIFFDGADFGHHRFAMSSF